MKYKVGDRVRITADENKLDIWEQASPKVKWLGKAMTVRATLPISKSYKMSEDKAESCGRGWDWPEGEIDGITDEHKIVITTDGKTTTAKLYDGKKFIKEATAKCSPEDEFDFKIGAELAFRRVLEVTSQKQFTGKAVYTSCSDHGLTRGKIYKFVDGYFWDDYNRKRPYSNGGYSENALEFGGFLPIKE